MVLGSVVDQACAGCVERRRDASVRLVALRAISTLDLSRYMGASLTMIDRLASWTANLTKPRSQRPITIDPERPRPDVQQSRVGQ
jgi:hypothetical protein